MRSLSMDMNMPIRTGFELPDLLSFPIAASMPAAAAASAAGRPDLPASQIDLGPGVEVTRLTPGRFANAIQKNVQGRHALQVVREDMTSSFILSLEPDGSATVCRGWRYLSFNDGPQVHTSEQIREQLGYRGGWHQKGWWMILDLTLDDTVCLRVGEYSHLIPTHASGWHLRCLPVSPKNHPLLARPALACQSLDPQSVFGEDEPHLVAGILPGRWIVLGGGNGLRIKVEANSVGEGELPVLRAEDSEEPLREDAWEHSF